MSKLPPVPETAPPVFMLTTPKNILRPEALASIAQLQLKGFKTIIPFEGVVRSTERSKIVMDGWKKFYSMLTGGLPRGFFIAEDDLFWEETWKQMRPRIKMDKINWVCYQKFFKEKQRDGSIKEIPVGNQFMYVPPNLVKKYGEDLMKAKSIHFDRWNSRYPLIDYTYKPHEVCAEMQHVSGTTGKTRAGAKLTTESLPLKKLFVGGDKTKSYAGIPIIKFFDKAKELYRQRLKEKGMKILPEVSGLSFPIIRNPKTGKIKLFNAEPKAIQPKVKKLRYKKK